MRSFPILVDLGLVVTAATAVLLLDRAGGVGSAHGRLAIGVLLVQDVIVAVVLTLPGGLATEGTAEIGALSLALVRAALGMAALGGATWAASRWLLPRLLDRIAPSSETLFVVSLTWCFLLILGAEWLHASIELGAFLAGLALAQLDYAHELARRVRPLADFFLAVFFVSLGAGMDVGAAMTVWPQALVLSAFVLLFKPALVAGLVLRRSGDRRTALLTGLTLGQMSEFGFILVGLAVASGLTESPQLQALTALVGLVTIGVSAVIVPAAPALVARVRGAADPSAPSLVPDHTPSGHIVVVGMNTLGRLIVSGFAPRGERVVAVDTDPTKLAGLPAVTVFGSADSAAVLREAGVERAKLVVAAPRIEDTNALLAYRCTRMYIPISVHAFDPSLADELLELGVDHVMISKVDGIRLVEVELHRLGVMG